MILAVENLGVKGILRGINFSVKRGERVIIVGESGSGKSTLLKSIAGFVPFSGKILFDGRKITRRDMGDKIGYIFQNAGASFCPIRKIGDQIFEAVRTHRDWNKKEFTARTEDFMQKINLSPAVLNEYPFRLSGGMAQRAGILAACILEPKLLLADEPTSALDIVTAAGVAKELLKMDAALIMVTHDLRLARLIGDRILTMERGELK